MHWTEIVDAIKGKGLKNAHEILRTTGTTNESD
jgi:hypothetical protein